MVSRCLLRQRPGSKRRNQEADLLNLNPTYIFRLVAVNLTQEGLFLCLGHSRQSRGILSSPAVEIRMVVQQYSVLCGDNSSKWPHATLGVLGCRRNERKL